MISIHALVKRATAKKKKTLAQQYISIHALVKRATGWDGADKVNPSISIHALVKRATFVRIVLVIVSIYFNPRPREEGDFVMINSIFVPRDFNPRPREEGDNKLVELIDEMGISIHALVKRATANLYNDYLYFGTKYHISDIFPQ